VSPLVSVNQDEEAYLLSILTGMVRRCRVPTPAQFFYWFIGFSALSTTQGSRAIQTGIIPLELRRTQSLDQRIGWAPDTFAPRLRPCVQIMVVCTSVWPNSSCTVRIS
jgi:hypothetical protein